MSQRSHRVGEQMKQEMMEIVGRKLKDPRVGFVTITAVEVTGDLSKATAYITTLGNEEEKEATLAGLTKATGFIRSEIGQRMKLRIVPELSFEFDKSVEYGNHIEELLTKLNKKD